MATNLRTQFLNFMTVERFSDHTKRLYLKTYWRKYLPSKWLFPGQKPQNHLTEAAAQRAYSLAKKKPA
jgi:hypothetical protein